MDKISIDKILEETNRYYNRKFTIKEFEEYSGISYNQVNKYYGKWWNVLSRFGYTKKKDVQLISKKPTQSMILDLLETAKDHYGASFSIPEFESLTGLDGYYPSKFFGSWKDALATIGCTPKASEIVSPEEIVSQLKDTYNLLGGLPSCNRFCQETGISQTVIEKRFGNYTGLLNAAGFNGQSSTVFGSKSDRAKRGRRNWKKNVKVRKNAEFTKQYGYSRPIGSFTQERLTSLMSEILGYCEKEKTFDWLTSPDTGANYRLDAYFPDYKIALEYQSELHFKEISWTTDTLEVKIRRDFHKRQLLQKHGIKLLEVAYFEPHTLDYLTDKVSYLL